MADVAIIVQARIRSSRLPAKTMLLLPNGLSVIENVLYNCRAIKKDAVVCAVIPDTPDCDILAKHITNSDACKGVKILRGPEDDVLRRYLIAAYALNAKHIMRITSDCPLISPDICSLVLDEHMNATPSGYTSNVHPRSFPHGYDCEVFTKDLLIQADATATDQYDREHVTPWIVRNAENVLNVAQDRDESDIRFVLDTVDDYINICEVFR